MGNILVDEDMRDIMSMTRKRRKKEKMWGNEMK
jgi:hypothetical protein